MLAFNQNPPRLNVSVDKVIGDSLKYQFCFLNRPFVAETNPKDIYYKLLIWPKADTIIDNFSFLIKINDHGVLKPLEFLEFPKLGSDRFDPFGDQHIVVKIPQVYYQSKLQFAFSFSAFDYQTQGQIDIDLNWFDSHQIDNILLFYDQKTQESTNLLTWNLKTFIPELTFNATYPYLFNLTTNLVDSTFEITNYDSVKKLRFLALLENQKPELKNLVIDSSTTKKAYAFEPRINWITHENLAQKTYQLQLTNQLELIGGQIQEIGQGDIGFKANPLVINNQVLSLNFTFLNHEYNLPIPIKSTSLYQLNHWTGPYFEV